MDFVASVDFFLVCFQIIVADHIIINFSVMFFLVKYETVFILKNMVVVKYLLIHITGMLGVIIFSTFSTFLNSILIFNIMLIN